MEGMGLKLTPVLVRCLLSPPGMSAWAYSWCFLDSQLGFFRVAMSSRSTNYRPRQAWGPKKRLTNAGANFRLIPAI